MSTKNLLSVVLVAAFIMLTAGVQAQVPQVINYQGQLTDASGNPATGTFTMIFKIFDASSGGTQLYTETQSVTVSNGVFNVLIGSVNPIPLNLFDSGTERHLEVTVNGTVLTPRRRFGSVPYAFTSRGSGDITAVNAGTGLNGGGTSGDVTLTLDTGFTDGRYVNEGQADAITSSMIQDNAVGNSDIANGAVTTAKVASGQVVKSINSLKDDVTLAAGSNVSITPSGNTLTVSATAGGDITAVNAGTGLTGGGSSGDVTLNLNTGFTDGRYVEEGQANSISSSMIQDGTIQQSDLGFSAGDITAVNAGTGLTGGGSSGEVTLNLNTSFTDGQYVNEGQDNSISSSMIQDGQVTNSDLANNAVNSAKIQDGTIQQSDLGFSAGDITAVNAGSGLTGGATSGDATLSVANNGITSAMIQDNTIVNADVNTNAAIAGTKISPNFGSQNIVTTGRVGIGTTSPVAKLHVSHAEPGGEAGLALDVVHTGNFIRVARIQATDATGFQAEDDLLEIRAPAAAPNDFQFIEAQREIADLKFRVQGDGNVLADGSFTGPADFAEMIEVADGYLNAEPGDVMVISTSKDRAVEKCTEINSTRVLGIYSTKPGFLASEREWDAPNPGKDEAVTFDMAYMKQTYNEVPVAVVGIVPCKVSTENGPIKLGDLLVTSNTPGHAMKAPDDPKVGTIIGKALGSLATGTGKIKVYVTVH